MRKVMFFAMAVVACMTISASADVANWQAQAAATANNVVADGTGWTFDGTAGLSYDYGDLSNGDITAEVGTSIEFIFNLSDSGTSVALGTVNGWNNVEKNGMKLEQWDDTGVFGSGIETYWDNTFDGVASIFDTDVHAVFVTDAAGYLELFIDGVSKGTDGRAGGWVNNGGVGSLGSTSSLTTDIAVGTIYAVGSYDRALTAAEVTALYDSYATPPNKAMNPEP